MSGIRLFDQPLEEIRVLLLQCSDLGNRMVEACNAAKDMSEISRLHEERNQLMEEVGRSVNIYGIDSGVVNSNVGNAQSVKQLIQLLIDQNQEIESLLSNWQREIVVKMQGLNGAERASRAYDRWHPIRVMAERLD